MRRSGLVRADGTPKPAFDALKSLVTTDWWLAETATRTDAAGRFTLDAYLGDYTVTADGAGAAFSVAADAPAPTVRLGGRAP